MSRTSYLLPCGVAHVLVAAALVAQEAPTRATPSPTAALPVAALPVAPAARASWRPDRPVAGTLIEVAIRPSSPSDSLASVRGTLAGEPLHFTWDGRGAFRALAGIPIGSVGSVSALVVLEGPVASDTVMVSVPVVAGTYPAEQLRVAPEFGREPDSALAARLAAEAGRALAVSRGAHETPRLWRASFLLPRPGRVTSGFGRRREFNGIVQSRHMGVDFAGASGAPVRAANRGVVALVGDFYLAGNVIYLDHGAGLVTAYFHLSRAEVEVGDTVSRGQLIGRVGATGRVTGPHLHWVARYGAVTVDPLSLVALGRSPPRASAGPASPRERR